MAVGTGPAQARAYYQSIMGWGGAYGALPFPAEVLATDGFWGGGAAIVFSCEPIEELIRVTQMILVKLVGLKNKTKHRKIAATSHEAGKGWGGGGIGVRRR